MNISEVRVKLVSDRSERVRAFCSVTFDGEFVIRDLKVIEGTNGLFVAMPSRKLADRCPRCGGKNHMRARFCNNCGAKLDENRAARASDGRAKLHADVAHPINALCREKIQSAVVESVTRELELAKEPGYQPQSLDDDDGDGHSEYDDFLSELRQTVGRRGDGAEPSADGPAKNLDGMARPGSIRIPPAGKRMPMNISAKAEVEAAPPAPPAPPASRPVAASPPPVATRPIPAKQETKDDGFGAGID